MNFEALTILMNYLLPVLILITVFFFYRKVYFHYKFLGLHYPKLKDKSILDLLFEPFTFLEFFYIIIPIFIKSERKKEGEELKLETLTARSLTMFYIMLATTMALAVVLDRVVNKM
jgi:hypothetical protein